MPFSFAYDSNGAFGSIISVAGQGTFVNNPQFLSQGGWSYSVPLVSAQEIQVPGGKGNCPELIDFVFQDPLGTRHALGLASIYPPPGAECPGGVSVTTGGDDAVRSYLPGCTSSGLCWRVTIADADGTAYLYSSSMTHGTIGSMGSSLPYAVEDRNGNQLTFTDNNGGAFTVSDTLGRTVLSSSGFGTSGNTLTASGLSAYTVYWTTSSYNVASNAAWALGGSPSNQCRGMNNAAGTSSVISGITLPNGQSYQFFYDSSYGLIKEIIYPTGAKVTYTWGQNPQSEFTAFADQAGNKQGCGYTYDTAAITDRYVYYDGSTLALHQHFAYSPQTQWNSPPTSWNQKTTVVTTYDLLRGVNSQATYTYGPVTVPNQPYDYTIFANQIPVEQTVAYDGWSGTLLRTVNKSWADRFEMVCASTTQGGTTARIDYAYSSYGMQVTDKKEWDWGKQSACPTPYTAPTGTPLRETITAYASLGDTLAYTAGPSIFDRPSSVTIYGNGAQAAQTTYVYDGTSPSSAGITVGRDTAYNGNTTVARGNATSMSKWVSSSSGSLTWTYAYDDTGQQLSAADPKGNSTGYSYTDEFPACGSPPGSTNAYLTKITDAKGFTQSFTYRYCDGQLNSSADRNGQTTGYSYADSLNRLTSMSYPDGGSTTYGYGSNVCALPSSTTILLSGSSNYTETATLDGVCQVTETAITSDPAGSDYKATTYDGSGRVWTVSNPYRSTSDPSYGIATYTYDALGRSTKVTYADSSATSTTYSANCSAHSDDCSTVTDPAGKARQLWTDGLGRLTWVNEAGLYTTGYGYDALDDLSTVTQGVQTRSYSYDGLARLLSATNPESGTATYSYPVSGVICAGDPSAPCARTDARGITTTYSYDALNRLTSKTYSDGTPTASFSYDEASVALGSWTSPTLSYPKGRRTHTTTTSGSTLLTATVQDYDPMGRTKDYWQCTPLNCGMSSIWAALYNYDKAGDITSWNHPAGFTITQSIDGARQLQQVTSTLSDSSHPGTLALGTCLPSSTSICYTAWGAVSQLQNGCVGSGCTSLQESYFYNNRLQVAVAELGTASSDAADSCRVYNFYAGVANASACSESPSAWPTGTNNNGNVAGYYYNDNVNGGLDHKAAYTYDGVNRLSSAAATGSSTYSQTFSYDQYGNMDCTASPAENECLAPTYNASTNRITTSGYQYDSAGDIIGDGTNTYQWDAEGRLTKVVNGAGTAISANTYNALGQRARDVTTSATTDEAYGVPGILLWRYTGNSSTNRSFVPFNGRTLAEYYSGGTLFDHPDELGSNTTSTSYNGSACQEELFYPFGQLWTGAGSCGMQQTFAQLPDYDSETDQYNTLNRHYNPMGRWLSPDPGGEKVVKLGDPQTWNMYAYVRNNPTTLTDPSGLDFMIACTKESWTCGHVEGYQGLYQGLTASTGENGEVEFTPTVVTQTASGGLEDQAGMSYAGYFDQGGVHLTSLDSSVSGSGQFVEQSKETDLYGSGIYLGTRGQFIDACGGSCKARGSIIDWFFHGAVDRAEGFLNQRSWFTTALDRLSGAHDPGTQWMDSAGLSHVIAFSAGVNQGKTELHFEGSPVHGIDVIPHLARAFKDLVDGDAAAHRAVVLP